MNERSMFAAGHTPMRTCTRCERDFAREVGPSTCTSCLLEMGEMECVRCGGKIEQRGVIVCNACIKPAEPIPGYVMREVRRHNTFGPNYGSNR